MARSLAAALAAALLVAVPSAAGAQTPRLGGTVFYVAGTEPPCLNVFIPACSVIAGWAVPELVLKGAFSFAPGNTLRPELVSRVAYTREPPFKLTYYIRPDAHWSDGVQISAQDFVFTHRAYLTYAPSDIHGTMVQSVRALGPKTVRVVLRTRFAGWRSLFRVVLPHHALAGEDLTTVWRDRIDNPKTGRPIGSGPFLVQRWERGKQLTLVRNAGYWGPHRVYLDRVVVRSLKPTEDLRRGEFDILWARVGPQDDFPRVPGYTRGFRPGQAFQHISIRRGPGGHPALKLKLVRRALAYGIDRVGIVRALFGNLAPSWRPLDSTVFLTQSPFYRRNWASYRYRPAEARRLLEQAGCRLGTDAIYDCNGERLSLRIFTTAGNPGGSSRSGSPRSSSEGWESRSSPLTPLSAALFGQILLSGDFDLSLHGLAFGPDPIGRDDIFGCEGASNLIGYCQRLVTRDLDQADRILDQNEQARVLNRADVQMAKDVPVIPLFQGPSPSTSDRTSGTSS